MIKKYSNYFSHESLEESFNIKVRKVKSKGIDKKSAESFKKNRKEELLNVEKKIEAGSFKFSPYLELLKIKKRNSLPRLLSIPTIRDRIVHDKMKDCLHQEFKDFVNKELPNSYIRKIKKYIEKNEGEKIFYLKTDITKFYDEINREILKTALERVIDDKVLINLICNAIETPTVPSNYRKGDLKKYYAEKGVPQGLAISNILAQIYLKEFDNYFKKRLKSSLYLRYVDDIFVLSMSNSKPLLKSIKKKLSEIDLQTNDDKTFFGDLSSGVEFLGYLIKNEEISISKSTIEGQINKIAAKITWFKKGMANRKLRPALLVNNDNGFKRLFLKEVNEIITGSKSAKKNYGWLFWYLEINDLSVFYKIDLIIESMFRSLNIFKGKVPKRLKKTVKAYFEIKYNNGGDYINDYNKFSTISKKRKMLVDTSQIAPNIKYSDSEINKAYEQYRDSNLKILEKDIIY